MWSCWASSCFRIYPTVQAIGDNGWEVKLLNMSTICNATISHVPEVRWNFRSTTCFLTRTPRSTSVLAWIGSQVLPLLWHCANKCLYCLPLSIQCRWTHTWIWSMHRKILDFARSNISEYACWCQWLKHLVVRAKCIALTSQAAKFKVSTYPRSSHTSSNFVAQLLDGSVCETPTSNEESDNKWTFILISFAAGSCSNASLTNEMCSSPAIFPCCMRLCVRSMFSLVVVQTV